MKIRSGQRKLCGALLLTVAIAQPVFAEGEINLDELRQDLRQAGSLPADFKPLDDSAGPSREATKKLEEAEEQLLQQINNSTGGQAAPMLDEGFGRNPQQGSDEAEAPVKAAVATRFLETARPVEAEPAIESPAEIVAARVAAQDQVIEPAPSFEEPVIAPKPAKRANGENSGKNKVAAVRRAAMVSNDISAGDEQSVAELQDLIKRHGAIKADLKRQTDSAAKFKKKSDDLSDQLGKAEAKIKSLEQELTEARNRLIISETEVERLSGLMVTTVRSSKSLAKLDSIPSGGTGAPRAAAVVQSRRPAEQQPAEEMPVATVVVEKANLRTGPGNEHSPLMSVTRGTRLLVEIRRGEWYRIISPSGTRAWVSADVVAFGSSAQASPTKTVKVKAFDPALEP